MICFKLRFFFRQRLLFAVLVLVLAQNFSAFAAELPLRQFPAGINLAGRVHNTNVIAALGNRLPEVAAFYRKSPEELRALLQRDHSLWADRAGRLFYVCPGLAATEEAVTGVSVGTTDPSPFPSDQTFRLHSRPGLGKVIFLQFNGYDASATTWGADAIARPFDIDGDPNTFNATERDRIVYIWQRVAEDYAMFDIDVTTEDPGAAALVKSSTGDTNYGVRTVIGGSGSDWYGSAGGVAYVGTFDDNAGRPCWVFPKSLGPDNEKYIAEAVSHEVGHTLGLNHDGRTSPVEGYFAGQGNWAPIMGVGYYEPIAQWSKGEYASANNTEDDFVVMQANGAVFRTDDHGNNTGTATVLNGVTFSTNGVISQRTDLDFFRFTTGDGRVAINVNRAPRDANLRLQVTLYDSGGALLQTTNVADTTSGTQPVTLVATLAAGIYYFAVDGIGSGDPLTNGYSDYASLGQYLVTGTLAVDSAWLPTAAGGYQWNTPANWASNTIPNGVGAVWRMNNNLVGNQIIDLTAAVTLGRLFLGDANATHSFTLQTNGGSLTFNNLNSSASISKTGGLDDVIAAPLQLAGNLVITNTSATATLVLSNGMSGAGSLRKEGGGNLFLHGTASHAGGTTVAAGNLIFGATAALNGNVTIRAVANVDASALAGGWSLATGQTLDGAGSVAGNVSALTGAVLSPGGAGAAGTLTFSNDLALANGSKLNFDLAATTTPGGGTNDLINVLGNLTLAGIVNVDVTYLNQLPAAPGTYTLLRCTGSLTGGAANFAAVNDTNRFLLAFDDTTPGEIRLQISGAPTALVWSGDGVVNAWNLATTNWLDGVSPVNFQQLDSVLFTDVGSATPSVTISGTLTPQAVTVNATNNYTLAGAGKISGVTALTKQGGGTLTLSTANDFSGAVNVVGGTLKIGNPAALGTTNGSTVVQANTTLDLNAFNLGAETIIVSNGVSLVSSNVVTQSNALRFVTFGGDATFGGLGRWDIRANPTATLNGNNFALTKTGTNQVWLVDLGNTGLGSISVNQGTLGIQDSTTLGNSASNLTVAAGASLSLWNTDVNALHKQLVMNGGTLDSLAGDNIFSGPVLLNSTMPVSVAAQLVMQGIISGAGGLTKTGSGTLNLTNANTFDGNIAVNQGTLRTANAAALGSVVGSTTIAADARLDLGGSSLGAEIINVTGDGLGNAGAIINLGAAQPSALRFVTLNGNTTFGGINRWDLKANPTGALTGNNRTLTKRGPNEVWLVNLAETGLGAMVIAEGKLGFQGTATMGSVASNLTVSAGGILGLWATGTNVLTKAMTFSGGVIYNGNGTNVLAGNCVSTGSNTLDIAAGTALELRGVISSSGAWWNLTGGTAIFSGTNTYTGVTVIKAGTLQIGNGGGSGLPGTGVITNNAALVFNRSNDFTVANVITGSGTLTKLGAGVLTLTGNSSFTNTVAVNALNSGILRVRSATALGLGPKIINLKSSGSPNSSGTFGVEVENNVTLASDLTWNVSNDGLGASPFIPALRSRSGVNAMAGDVLVQSGGGGARLVSDSGSTLNLTGRLTTDVAGGSALYLDGAGSGVVSGTISNGTAATMFLTVSKEGAGTWTLTGTNFSSGVTLVKAGTFQLNGLVGTNSLIVSNGATLRGTGIVRGATVVNGSLTPGTVAAIGALAVSNQLTLTGACAFRIAKNPGVMNDQVFGVNTVNYGGSLQVTLTAGAPQLGDSFKLFSAASYSGNFSAITLPALSAGLTWTNRLTQNGTLAVVPVAAPLLTTLSLTNGTLNFQLATESGVTYVLEQTPSLTPPVTWTATDTNLGTGSVWLLNLPVNAPSVGQFFRVRAF